MANSPERRELSFGSLDEALTDAEQLAKGNVRTTGNHSFAEILEHLALTHDLSCGKIVGPRPSFMMRMMMPFIKGSILKGPAKPGFNLPAKMEEFFWPAGVNDLQAALAHLKASVENYNSNGPLEVHPMFGKATSDQINNLNCCHCAMHLSFVHPA